ncbi:hypothetical protein J7E93_14465 [Streptomyces sp. ISL-36]|uniref:hypothetical protein n=1 Tax=Streptomyces sp. ISL-36 TaxID=2819182 RepID=UPI001BEB7E49|nr:hypothetical protein [Streptomyces sp. ISL-36]MBT2441292.1 hypothetical protein [Streptomyces sp. ISL-36]
MTREPDTDEGPAPGADLPADVRAAAPLDAGEALAREAFRAARDAGKHRTLRTRRQDDWRPARVRRRWRGSLRTAAFGVAATVLLGGVAVAAAGSVDPVEPAPEGGPAHERPSAPGASAGPGATYGGPGELTAPVRPAAEGRREPAAAPEDETQGRDRDRDKGHGAGPVRGGRGIDRRHELKGDHGAQGRHRPKDFRNDGPGRARP